MRPRDAIRRWVWRRLEPRIRFVVDRRLDPVFAHLHAASRTAQEAEQLAARVREALATTTDLDRLQDDLDRMDRTLRGAADTAAEARRLARESVRAAEEVRRTEAALWRAVDPAGRE